MRYGGISRTSTIRTAVPARYWNSSATVANPPVMFSPHAMIANVNIDRPRPLSSIGLRRVGKNSPVRTLATTARNTSASSSPTSTHEVLVPGNDAMNVP